MDNNITKFIIAGVIVAILLMGGSVLWGLFSRDSAKTADQALGIESREVTASEVAKHAKADDCWVILGGVVYDGTTTIANNPDNKELLTSVCGKDGYEVYTVQKYKEQELSDQAIQKLGDQLTAYKIGILVP